MCMHIYLYICIFYNVCVCHMYMCVICTCVSYVHVEESSKRRRCFFLLESKPRDNATLKLSSKFK